MREVEQRVQRRIRETADLEQPVYLAAPLERVALPPSGAGTFGALVDRHWFLAGVLGMLVSGTVLASPLVGTLAAWGCPVLAVLGGLMAKQLASKGQLGQADVMASLSALALATAGLAVWLGGSLVH